jgi:hypothetical protein
VLLILLVLLALTDPRQHLLARVAALRPLRPQGATLYLMLCLLAMMAPVGSWQRSLGVPPVPNPRQHSLGVPPVPNPRQQPEAEHLHMSLQRRRMQGFAQAPLQPRAAAFA